MKNIVFDFGGVLMLHNAEGRMAAFRQFMSDDAIFRVLGLGNKDGRTLARLFDAGEIDTAAFLRQVLEHSRPGTTDRMIIDAWNIMHAGIPDDTWTKLRLLKSKGYHLTLMSNTNEIHWAHTQSLYRDLLDECFEAVFLSFREHCAKPDEAFFRRVNSAIHAVPDETFFVDDLAINRDAARNSVLWLPCADMEELMAKLK